MAGASPRWAWKADAKAVQEREDFVDFARPLWAQAAGKAAQQGPTGRRPEPCCRSIIAISVSSGSASPT